MCLGSHCSAMGGPDRYIKAHNVVPWTPHISLFLLKCSAMGGLDRYV